MARLYVLKTNTIKTREIIDCVMEVHNILGNGFQEVVYQRTTKAAFEVFWKISSNKCNHQIHYIGLCRACNN